MDYTESLLKSHLFRGINKEDIQKLLKCLNAEYREYENNETVFSEGDEVTKVGVVLSGQARSIKIDASGRAVIVSMVEKYGYIGVLVAASHDRKSPVTVQAHGKLSVLFLSVEHIIKSCRNVCDFHHLLIGNYIDAMAEKALVLHDRNDCLIKSTIREKVITYLVIEAKAAKSQSFMIPFDREAMAEYLNVDRSALSRELSSMKRDGLIDYYKNSFKLIKISV